MINYWVICYSSITPPLYFHGVSPERTDYQFTEWRPSIEEAVQFGTLAAANFASRRTGGYAVEIRDGVQQPAKAGEFFEVCR